MHPTPADAATLAEVKPADLASIPPVAADLMTDDGYDGDGYWASLTDADLAEMAGMAWASDMADSGLPCW